MGCVDGLRLVLWIGVVLRGDASSCLKTWPSVEEKAPPLFWMHAPKTGTTFRMHMTHLACPRHRRPKGRSRFDAAHVKTLKQQKTPCLHDFDEASFAGHESFDGRFCGSGVTMLREPRSRLISAFHYHRHGLPRGRGQGRACFAMGIPGNQVAECEALRALPEKEQVLAYANNSRAANVQTKMVLGLGRFDPIPVDRLDVREAKRRLRDCFAFVGLTERRTGAWRARLLRCHLLNFGVV